MIHNSDPIMIKCRYVIDVTYFMHWFPYAGIKQIQDLLKNANQPPQMTSPCKIDGPFPYEVPELVSVVVKFCRGMLQHFTESLIKKEIQKDIIGDKRKKRLCCKNDHSPI